MNEFNYFKDDSIIRRNIKENENMCYELEEDIFNMHNQ